MIPLVAACRELVRRGHDVEVVSDPGTRRWRELLHAPVVELATPRLDEEPDFVAFHGEQSRRAPAERGAATAEMFVRKSLDRVPLLRAEVERFAPDVILRDYMFHAAWMVGAQLDLPVATFAFFPLSPSQFAGFFPEPFERAFATLRLPSDTALLDRWLTIYGMPPSWIGQQELPPTSHLIQPTDLPVDDDASVDDLLGAGDSRPLVYATLGTGFTDDPELWAMVFDGVSDLHVQVIATVGASADLSTVRAPTNVRLATFVPQALLLPHCRAVLGHGGYGTLMGALRVGVPVVSIPVGASDNVINARRVQDIGAGIALTRSDRSAADVRDAVRTVLQEQSFRSVAEHIASEIAALPPAEHAATLLEQLAETRRPVTVD